MRPWTVVEVCEALEVPGTSFLFEGERQFEFVSTDSRAQLGGALFVPLAGERFDGHDYVQSALDHGASACLWSRPEVPPELAGAPLVRCSDTLEALQRLGRYHLKHRTRCRVAAVTGSTGKTMTKDLLAALLSTRYRVYKTPGNYNNDIGLPLTLLALESDHDMVVLEMGMRGPGQIRRLARLVEPEVGIITNIGVSHIELLGSREAIADAKGELLECLAPQGLAVLPQRSEYLARLKAHAGGRKVVTFSGQGGAGADFEPADVANLGIEGWLFRMGGVSLRFPLPGPHLLEDFVAAWAGAEFFGIDPERVQTALAEVMVSQSRLEIHRLNDGTTILNDAYNAAPDSMKGALEVLSYAGGRRMAVLGDMLELGPIEEQAHRQVGQWVSQHHIEVLLAVGQRSRLMAEAAAGVGRVEWVPDTEAARSVLRALWQPGDTLLLKASRGMGLDKLMTVFQEVRV